MMEYNPAHKTSSITSITSTSTASTWDHPISNNNNYQALKQPEDATTHFEEYPEFDASLVSERIAIPPFEYFEDTTTATPSVNDSSFFHMFEQDAAASDELPDLMSSSSSAAIKNDSNSSNPNSTNITNENHNNPFASYGMTHSNVNHIEPIYLQQAHQMTLSASSSPTAYIMPATTTPAITTSIESKPSSCSPPAKQQRKVSIQSPVSLTEDEKRANHIVSEQKRRNTIRLGFKELTDIVPTLKNINNSKSTILFKAVEFMKHLDKRNRTLKDKVRSLQIKLQLQGKVQKPDTQKRKLFYQQQQQQQQLMLPPDTISALIAHKNQQKQLEQLQNQLRVQHQLLQQHNIISPFDNSPFLQQQQNQQKTYHSILIPSSRSSESDETDHHRAQEWNNNTSSN